jgi:ribosomal protein L22
MFRVIITYWDDRVESREFKFYPKATAYIVQKLLEHGEENGHNHKITVSIEWIDWQ